MLKRIHINQHKIRSNAKHDEQEAVITCKTSKKNHYAEKLHILDKDGVVIAEVVYTPCKPLSCGAKVWIETKADVRVVNGDEDYLIK